MIFLSEVFSLSFSVDTMSININEESRSNGIVCVSQDNSVVSMDTENSDYSADVFLTKGMDFDLTESCPEIYRCPISKELMKTPVMLHDDGHTYDETALKEWLSENTRSPLTGVDLQSTSYTRNYAIQSAIDQFSANKKAMETASKIAVNDDSVDMDLSEDEKEVELITAGFDADTEIYDPLKEFLSSIAMDEYVNTFISAGFVSMTDFANITFNDLIAMNIPIIHSRRMIKAIEEYNAQHGTRSDSDALSADVPLTNSIIIRPGKVPKSQNSAPLNCNILLLGDAYVGKTSLRKRLELDDFVTTQATQGVELTCLLSNFQGEDLQITIWDPAGQERYAPITKTFFRRAHAAAIIFDAKEPATWSHVEYWMHELEQNAPDDIEVMLICNKIDLLTDGESGDVEISDLIKKAINVAARKRIPFYMTSAKSGESVSTAFQELVSQLLNNHAILEKLYQQRDGCLAGRNSSYRGPNPYDSGSDPETPTRRRGSSGESKGSSKGSLLKIRKKLSWRNKKNHDEDFHEYTDNDYTKNINLESGMENARNHGSTRCCRG